MCQESGQAGVCERARTGRAGADEKSVATALTEMYLERLKRYDTVLKCSVTLTEERALAQARKRIRTSPRENIAGRCTGAMGRQGLLP